MSKSPMSGNTYPPNNAYPYPNHSTGYQQLQSEPPAPNTMPYQQPEQPDNFQPTAPPLDHLNKVPGYEEITFSTTTLKPPAYPGLPQQPPVRNIVSGFQGLTEEQVRDAALEYVAENCCYGKDAAREMIITNITMSSAFHYSLETFGEKRETAWAYDPYNGETLDTPMMGVAPGPWDIPLMPSKHFQDATQCMEVPHTASAMSCHVCTGVGMERCYKCQGFCYNTCTWCNGSGRRFSDRCTSCHASGRTRCTVCGATGQVKCRTCKGKGSLKCYVKLTATWTNHQDDFIAEYTNLPDELIKGVTGHVAFEEQCPQVWPVSHFPQTNINEASNNLVTKHSQAFPLERILQQSRDSGCLLRKKKDLNERQKLGKKLTLQQLAKHRERERINQQNHRAQKMGLNRHRIRIVPVAEIKYSWKNNSGDFFVYGFENKVFFPDYPQSCCWGCNIL